MSNKICPYPGLRTFSEAESIYFKGREESIKKTIELVQKNKFLMLTGSSGDGKSSMVFAGIIPQARAGIFSGEFPNWLVIDFKPQRDPIGSLAEIISEKLFKNENTRDIKQKLSLGFSALIDLYKSSDIYLDKNNPAYSSLPEDEQRKLKRKAKNLLIIVDQFEELFTNPENYADGIPSQSSKTLINNIIEANKIALEQNIPLYIICTMRSDYFGNCSSFGSLPELIGKSQYFIPRLTRKDIYRAIEDPAILSGNAIEPRLIERLLFEVKEGADILPVIQHALFRIWKEYDYDGAEKMDLIHFAKIGGMAAADLPDDQKKLFDAWLQQQTELKKKFLAHPSLSNVLNAHANEIAEFSIQSALQKHPDLDEETARRILDIAFIGMVRIDHGKAVRNRITVQEICDLTDDENINADLVFELLENFSKEENSLIRTFFDITDTRKNNKDRVLDITHEALIRNWIHLGALIKEETENKIVFNDLFIQVNKWLKGHKEKGFILPEGQAAYFSNWYKEGRFSNYYIQKKLEESDLYDSGIQKTHIDEFLEDSIAAVTKKKKILKGVLVTVSVFLLIAIWGFFSANKQKKIATKNYKKSKANELAMNSFVLSETDPTMAFHLAEEAYKIDSTSLASQALTNSYINGLFYSSILTGHSNIIYDVKFSEHLKSYITCSSGEVFIWDTQGNLKAKYYDPNARFNKITCSNKSNYFLISGDDYFITILDINGKLIKKVFTLIK